MSLRSSEVGVLWFLQRTSTGIKSYRLFTEFLKEPIYLWQNDGPERDDVIVFKYPRNPDISYIKRVVGIPGDKLSIKNNKLYINGKEKVFTGIPLSRQKEIISELLNSVKQLSGSLRQL